MSTLLSTQITDRMAAIAAGLRAASGFSTDIGASVQVAPTPVNADSAPACIIVPGVQRASGRYGGVQQIGRDYEVRGFVDWRAHQAIDEHALVDLVLWDLRRGFGTRDAALEGLIERIALRDDRPGYTDEGGSLVGGLLNLTVHYRLNAADPATAL